MQLLATSFQLILLNRNRTANGVELEVESKGACSFGPRHK